MQVFAITHIGEMADEPVILAICSTNELAVARAEGRVQEVFDDEPELAGQGWYMDTLYDVDNENGECQTIIGLFMADGTCVDSWNITEETVESQS